MSDPYLLLRRDLGEEIPPVQLPEGVVAAPLVSGDAAEIHALLQSAYANGFGSVAPDWLGWWELLIADSEFDRDLCFVAKADGQVVGFCLCWTTSFVKDLVVAPDWQGRGLGRALLAAALHALRRRGAEDVRLKVMDGNAVAQRLYEQMGFRPVVATPPAA